MSEVATKAGSTKAHVARAMYHIIRSPVITEKATMLSDKGTRCSASPSTPPSPRSRRGRRSVRRQGHGVNTLVQKGKTKRFRGRPGQRSDVKKAYVQLAEGQSIDLSVSLS